MSYKQVPFDEATPEQLRAFAQDHLGLDIHHNTGIDKIRSKIRTAYQKEHILVEDVGGQPDAPVVEQTVSVAQRTAAIKTEATKGTAKKVRIIINTSEEVGGEEPVPVGVNGSIMLIPRGKECEIPIAYFNVLKEAKRLVYDRGPNDELILPPREVQQYPFQVLALSA